MTEKVPVKPIKKTVVLHPIMDEYIRKSWAILIENGYDATYSMTVNFMLLIAIHGAIEEGGLSARTHEIIWEYASDQTTINQLNLQDHIASLRDIWGADR